MGCKALLTILTVLLIFFNLHLGLLKNMYPGLQTCAGTMGVTHRFQQNVRGHSMVLSGMLNNPYTVLPKPTRNDPARNRFRVPETCVYLYSNRWSKKEDFFMHCHDLRVKCGEEFIIV